MASKNLVKSDKATMKSIWSIVLELFSYKFAEDLNLSKLIFYVIIMVRIPMIPMPIMKFTKKNGCKTLAS